MRRMSQAKREIRRLFLSVGITKPPVDLKRIANKLKAEIVPQHFPRDMGISAILLKEGDHKVIAVNESHIKTRQRFSIAHEIGHLVLHANNAFLTVEKGIEDKHLFRRLDDTPPDAIEREANQFAAELLMPEEWIREDFVDLYNKDEEDIAGKLAKKYEVSQAALMFRLMNLNLV